MTESSGKIDEETPAGSPSRKPLLFLLLGFVAALAVGFGILQQRVSGAWDEAVVRIERWQTQIEGIDRTRDVLWGDAVDGEAFEAYQAACHGIRVASDAVARLESALDRSGVPSPETLAELQPAMDALREGAHRSRGARRFVFSHGLGDPPPDLNGVPGLVTLCEAHFSLGLDQGNEEVALWAILDGLQLAGDLLATPRMTEELIGATSLRQLMECIQEEDHWGALSTEGVDLLASALEILDRRLSVASWSVLAEGARLVSSIESGAVGANTKVRSRLEMWPYFFSFRAMFAEYTQRLAATVGQVEDICSAPHPDRLSLMERRIDLAPSMGRGDLPPVEGVYWGVSSLRLRAKARLRMLRMALDQRAGGRIVLKNPNGSPFRVRKSDGRLVIEAPQNPIWTIDVPLLD